LSDSPAPGARIDAGAAASKRGDRASADPADLEAVTRAASGDHEAFRVLVERYQGRAHGLALRILRDEEQAKDVVQEAFLKAYRTLDRFEGRSSFYTWFYRVVTNLCIDAKRRAPAGRAVEWDDAQALAVPVGSGLDAVDPASQHARSPAGELERAQLREAITRAIDALPEDARRTLLLREVDGLDYAEIAACLGIPKGTVMSRLHNARRRVRALLAEYGVTRGDEGDA
jgi:RNA polymerase sigma-70 factor (ECF subfamily)